MPCTESLEAKFAVTQALRLLLRFVFEDLSATYLEIAKDRLYLDHSGGYRRRSCQVRASDRRPVIGGVSSTCAEKVQHASLCVV